MLKKHPVLFGFLIASAVALVFYMFILGSFSILDDRSVNMLSFSDSIGVIEITGLIESSESTTKAIHDFAEDGQIRAILLRIDSPGGVVAPTQEIYQALMDARERKLIVASLGSTAASGGYYVASAAHTIISNPGTLTGSIGVLMEFISGQKAFETLGLKFQTVKSGRYKDAGSIARGLDSDQRRMLQGAVDDVHRQFVEAVAAGRGMEIEQVAALADGRVFSGAQALEVGLVDAIGSFYQAVDWVKDKLEIKGKVQLVYAEKPKPSFWDYIMDNLTSRLAQAIFEHNGAASLGRLYFK